MSDDSKLLTAHNDLDQISNEAGRDWLLSLDAGELLETLTWLRDRRCFGCGESQPLGHTCQCENDE